VLLLDEPTNDLDVNTMRRWKRRSQFAGCAVVIARPLVPRPHRNAHPGVRGDSTVRWFEGNYSQYDDYRREVLGIDDQPHRIRYKKLVRE
jgi:energy-dependent translational throttle protein EttA